MHLDRIESQSRTFNYTLNDKKSKNKLLKGAKRAKNLDVEVKSTCVNMRFNDGSYFEVIIPLMNAWKHSVDQEVLINGTAVHILEIDAGIENTDKHIDTKMTIVTENNRLVLHAYNSTQNLMV